MTIRVACSLALFGASVAWGQAAPPPAAPASAPMGAASQPAAPASAVAPPQAAITPPPAASTPPQAGITPPAAVAPPPQITPRQTMAAPFMNAPPPSPVVRAPVPPAPPTPPAKGLPPDAPKLVINGGTYSERRDLRRVIVNGEVVREGQDVGSGVVVERIEPQGVVLAYRGSRFHVLY